jgi:pilus assembly protein CpaF
MRPDRIIVGEVRGPEAFDMLQAMNTGHPGSLTTIHANSPQDAIWRLESMILMTGFEIPQPAIRDQIASALDLIIQQERLPGGERKIVSVAEVAQGQKSAKGKTELRVEDIFRYDQFGFEESGAVQGAFKTMISDPGFLKRIRRRGYSIQDELI